MKKIYVLLYLALSGPLCFAQHIPKPNVSIKWNPAGLVFGNVGIQAEYNFGKNSLTAKIGVPVSKHQVFQYDARDADFTMKSTSFLAGYRTYLSKKHMSGLYFEPYFKYVHQTSEGTGSADLGGENAVMSFTNEYNGTGVGVQLGIQFLVRKKLVIDLFFLGPEINSAKNNFKAIEISNAIPWSAAKADEAEKDIRNFIDKFPFVRNKTQITVDQDKKLVTANFKGAVPGYRIGVSFGVAF